MARSTRSAPLFLAPLAVLVACSDADTTGVDDPDGNGDAYDHGRTPGASAQDLLAASDFDRLVVQVHYVEGARPSDAGLQHLRDFLARRLNKPAGITVQAPQEISVPPRATYSASRTTTRRWPCSERRSASTRAIRSSSRHRRRWRA